MSDSHFLVQFNNQEPVELEALMSNPTLNNLPESIQTLKLDFQVDKDSTLSIVSLIALLELLIDNVKNPTEYTTLLSSLVNSMLIIKKLENDANLGADRY